MYVSTSIYISERWPTHGVRVGFFWMHIIPVAEYQFFRRTV
jgi:hypothetical protein